MIARAAIIQSHRPRGIYVSPDEAQLLLHAGWELIDDCPAPIGVKVAREEVLLAPPAEMGEVA